MIKIRFENYGKPSFGAAIMVDGANETLADQIALILRIVSRASGGMDSDQMLRRIRFQLKTLEDLGAENTIEQDLKLLNAARAFDLDDKTKS